MKRLIKKLIPLADAVLSPFVYPAAWIMRIVRRVGIQRLPLCRAVLLKVGVFPIRNHYYEPQFDYRGAKTKFNANRKLPGINWNVSGQLRFLEKLVFADELLDIPRDKPESLGFYFNNGAFEVGDAGYWYQLVRAVKPRIIMEIGSGHSTLMATRAIERNRHDDPLFQCEQVCIEPYEMPWLEKLPVSVVRNKVEEIELEYFSRLGENDILFIDSSHVIRPQGDVVFEYLEILPFLKQGVIVHVHDIFSPKNYPRQWVQDEVRLWNEQYLLESFLTHNDSWEILGALNFLHANHYDKFKMVAPFSTPERGPGSFYMKKISG